MQQHKLPTYFNPLHSYHAVDTSEHGGNGINIAPRRFSWRLLLVLFLPPFLIISGLWFKTHPTFAEDLSIALELSVDAHITLHPNIIPFETASTQDTPVPQVDAAILGEATPKWTAKASASIPAFPRAINLSPNAPKADEILFVMATNADRAISSARWWLWPSYLKNPSSPCFVLLPPTDAHRVLDVEAEFRKQGLECIAKASHDPVYQHRVLSLPGEAKRHMGERMNSIRWLIMGDE